MTSIWIGFFKNGLPSFYPNQNNEEILSQSVLEPEGDVGDLGYVSDTIYQACTVSIFFLFNISFYFITRTIY